MSNNASMIRDDGEVFPVKIHLYGNPESIEETAWAAEWLYNHTLSDDTKNKCLSLIKTWILEEVSEGLNKEEATDYINDLGYLVVSEQFINNHWDKIIKAPDEDSEKLNREVINLLNQEFLRYRYGGRLDTDNNSKEAVFRVSSNGFNWFDIIWAYVYEHKNTIDSVTIVRDLESTGSDKPYRHNGKIFDKMPVNEFIELSGKPVIEKYMKAMVPKHIKYNGRIYEAVSNNDEFIDKSEIFPGDFHLVKSIYDDFKTELNKFPSSRSMDSMSPEYDEAKGSFYNKYRPVVDKSSELLKQLSISGYGKNDFVLVKIKDMLNNIVYNFPYGWRYFK